MFDLTIHSLETVVIYYTIKPMCDAGFLANTNIRWKDFQKELQKRLRVDSSCIPNSSAQAVSQVGFLSQVYFVDLTWFPEVSKIPTKLVLKVPVSNFKEDDDEVKLDQARMRRMIKKFFEAECSFYKFFKRHEHTPFTSALSIPHFYYSAMYDHDLPYIVLECIENSHSLHIYDNMDARHIDQILRFLARLQAFGYKNKIEKVEGMPRNLFKFLYGDIFTKTDQLKMYKSVPGFYGRELQNLVERVVSEADTIFDVDIGEKICLNMLMPLTLQHGDMWSTNILWDNNVDELKSVIDWQMVNLGCPVEDLIRLFNSCLSGKARREQWKFYLQRFYWYLEEEMGTVPYFLETLLHAYEAMYPMATFIYIPPLVPIVQNALDETFTDEKLKEEKKAIVAEKVKCMLEDILEINAKRCSY